MQRRSIVAPVRAGTVLFAAFLVVFAGSRSFAAAPSCPAGAKAPSGAVTAIGSANSAFGDALLARVQAGAPLRTAVVSPLSVSTVLALMGSGAQGATRSEFEFALQLRRAGLTLDQVGENQRALLATLKPCGATRFDLANSIWAAGSVGLNRGFVQREQPRFDAEIKAVDFANPQTVAAINLWVADKTSRKIVKIVGALGPQTQMVLVNALYFKGRWEKPFDKELTQPLPFRFADGSATPVPAMRRIGAMPYFETPSFQAVALPFADPRYEMVAVLPRAGTTALAEGWAAQMQSAQFHYARVQLALPRMHLAWEGELSEPLQKLGLRLAFGGGDFSGLANLPLRIDQVLHKVVFDADEEGAEGAAATAVVVALAAVRPPPAIDMTFDRPYYVLVRERTTGTVLFLGYVADPGARP